MISFGIHNERFFADGGRVVICTNRGAPNNLETVIKSSVESHASSVIMAKNSCSLISPSPSKSNSSIMAWL
jgi:hypothetical protein